MNALSQKLRIAYEKLDDSTIRALVAGRGLAAAGCDMDRVAMAFGWMAGGERALAEQALGALAGDATASRGDVAYVRGLAADLDGDQARVVEVMAPHMDDEASVHGRRIRLRVAEACIRLNDHVRAARALEPLLAPPGVAESLEAHLIKLEGMLLTGMEKEILIEQATLIDVLLERGFRLSSPHNVVYYARLMEEHRIEAVVGRMLASHDHLLDLYDPGDEVAVRFLLGAGAKHKCPAAVRAAGRGYVAAPFAWGGADADRIAYTFTSHECHEAAVATLRASYSPREIARNQSLWGPHIVALFWSGRWADTLAVIQEHREQIRKLPMRDNSMMVRAVCEFHLGRTKECLAGIAALGARWYHECRAYDAAVEPLALMRAGRDADVAGAIRRALSCDNARQDPQYGNEYANTILGYCMAHDDAHGLSCWARGVWGALDPATRPAMMTTVAELAVEWGYPEGPEVVAELVAAEGDPAQAGRCAYLAALAHNLRGDAAAMLAAFDLAAGNIGALDGQQFAIVRARWMRRHGLLADSLAAVEVMLQDPAAGPRRSAMLAIKAGLLGDLEAPETEVETVKALTDQAIRQAAMSRDHYMMLFAEASALNLGDRPGALLAEARRHIKGAGNLLEAHRLARRVIVAHDATAEQCEAAREIVAVARK